MRRTLCAAATAAVLGSGAAAGPAALADPPQPPPPAHLVGAATIDISPHETLTGRTVSITGACAPYPGAGVRSVSSAAGPVDLTDLDPAHIRGTLLVTAGEGTYPVRLVCSNGSAETQLRVDAPAPGPAPTPHPGPPAPAQPGGHSGAPAPANQRVGYTGPGGLTEQRAQGGMASAMNSRPSSGDVPHGANRNRAAVSHDDPLGMEVLLAGVGVAVATAAVVTAVRRPSHRSASGPHGDRD
ncbi:hypothetical protein ACQEVS_32835 [Streptomyces sp. CA-181903]|uniref:hypothetical protein n=1 Tax=Streptomyces sp. CA-181903 TaxID=3240055 RepID=UPI003D94E7A9